MIADRYHARALATPREVRNALLYVLNNARRHAPDPRELRRDVADPFSSGPLFDGWASPPFEPEVREGRMYGRGTADDKGQLMTFLEAMRGWIKATGQ